MTSVWLLPFPLPFPPLWTVCSLTLSPPFATVIRPRPVFCFSVFLADVSRRIFRTVFGGAGHPPSFHFFKAVGSRVFVVGWHCPPARSSFFPPLRMFPPLQGVDLGLWAGIRKATDFA